ncbi:MAG TPA: KTSC domain-containing protein [Pyrinomonadaceae bacterium]|nr:KTSC domain-containing protein [Pyrinomonadaceae bacterium]
MLEYVRYDEAARHLDVIFRTGDKYRYLNVPPLEYVGLMEAKSKGQYMHKRILGDRYEYERFD